MKAVIIVIDSFGIGHLPDARDYGDLGANTALHICQNIEAIHLPNLTRWGLGNCSEILGNPLPGVPAVAQALASYGVMAERSPGKDTTTGHWELAGIVLERPFPVFSPVAPSFPPEIIEPFCRAIGSGVLGNEAASGTEIIERLGEAHLESGQPIVYTSADSVLQIAAHESIIPIERLYEMCRLAREICDPFQVGRVIARPFVGQSGSFQRTQRRRDFSIALPEPSILDYLTAEGIPTLAVGKIGNIFNEQGISESFPDKGNPDCLARTTTLLRDYQGERCFIFVNLVDTDMIYGHRRDVRGYCHALEEIDREIGAMIALLDEGDLLMVSADHGCDPTFRGSDHTREYVPLLACRKGSAARSLGIRETFADAAQTVAHYFGLRPIRNGESFLESVPLPEGSGIAF